MRSEKISREFNNNPLHQLIRLGHLEIYIFLSNPNIDVRILAQGYYVIVLPSLVYPYFELEIEQDEIRKE